MVYSQCAICKNYVLGKKCWAFPNGIPKAVFENKVIHDHVLDGQSDNYVFNGTSDSQR
jgi:hypothetical protein